MGYTLLSPGFGKALHGMAFPYGTHSWRCVDPPAFHVTWQRSVRAGVGASRCPSRLGWQGACRKGASDVGKEVSPSTNQPPLQEEVPSARTTFSCHSRRKGPAGTSPRRLPGRTGVSLINEVRWETARKPPPVRLGMAKGRPGT